MGEQKVTRKRSKNNPIIVEARKKAYFAGKADGYKEGFEAGRRSLDNYINTLHNHYKYLINNISYVSFDEIKFVYKKETDPHFVDKIALYWRFNHKDYGPLPIPYHNLPLLCERLNEAFERIIWEAKEERGDDLSQSVGCTQKK